MDGTIEALIMAVTADPNVKAEALRKLAKAIWWAGFNTAKQVDYQRDMALQYAVEATSADTATVLQLMRARAFEKYLAGELQELPAITDTPVRDKYDKGMTDEQVLTIEAQRLLKSLGL